MARSWEYARWRRIVMQAVLCGMLCVTVTLAWWMQRSKSATLGVKLDREQLFANPLLNLDVQPPLGWRVERETGSARAWVTFVEPKGTAGPQRQIRLALQLIPTGTDITNTEEALFAKMGERSPVNATQPLDFLGSKGVLKEFGAERIVSNGIVMLSEPVMVACAMVPQPRPTIITVVLTGPRTFVPADVELIRQVALSLKPADPKHPVPALPNLPVMPGETDEFGGVTSEDSAPVRPPPGDGNGD